MVLPLTHPQGKEDGFPMFIKNWYLQRFRLLQAWLRQIGQAPHAEPATMEKTPETTATQSEPVTHRFYVDIV
jgi:hypothetical protein